MEAVPAAAEAGEAAAMKVDTVGATANGVPKEGSVRAAKPVRSAAALQPVRQRKLLEQWAAAVHHAVGPARQLIAVCAAAGTLELNP